MSRTFLLVMAGGQGTRFWPLSSAQNPKQYLNFHLPHSLLTETFKRYSPLVKADHKFMITVEEQEALAKKHAGELIHPQGILKEPCGRNTAPCIYYSLLQLLERGGMELEDVLIVAPADHYIPDKDKFLKLMEKATELARTHPRILTMGIRPTHPHTGYGYIKGGESLEKGFFQVERFVEKPNKEKAQEYLREGNYYWNSGMFVATGHLWREEIEKHLPNLASQKGPLLQNPKDIYPTLESVPIDTGVMEKSSRVGMLELDLNWNDLGNWTALEELSKPEELNTLLSQNADGPHQLNTFVEDASGNIVSTCGKNIALVNVSNLIVVNTPDTLMVIPKEDGQKVKKLAQYFNQKPKHSP